MLAAGRPVLPEAAASPDAGRSWPRLGRRGRGKPIWSSQPNFSTTYPNFSVYSQGAPLRSQRFWACTVFLIWAWGHSAGSPIALHVGDSYRTIVSRT
eukprot:scaffold5230_cov120-Isochrysis_galbana.AAC.2